MIKILVIGSTKLDPGAEELRPQLGQFIKSLGAEIASRGHLLYTGIMNDADRLAAEGASEWLEQHDEEPARKVIGYLAKGADGPTEYPGRILRSQYADWTRPKRGGVPEQIENADVIVMVGGGTGTKFAAQWGDSLKKPLVPVPAFGGTAEEFYGHLRNSYHNKPELKQRFEDLSTLPGEGLASSTLSFVEFLLSSDEVCGVMSYDDDQTLAVARTAFENVCSRRGYHFSVVDQTTADERIVQTIMNRIEKSAFVIVDLTVPRPNVYFELGYALGRNKRCLYTAHHDPKSGPLDLPFDVKDLPVLMWQSPYRLEEMLEKKLDEMGLRARPIQERVRRDSTSV